MEDLPIERFAIRTITAGVELRSFEDLAVLEGIAGFLDKARRRFAEAGYQVQSSRIATQSLAILCSDRGLPESLRSLVTLDRLAGDLGLMISVGSLLGAETSPESFGSFSADLAAATSEIYFSVSVATPDSGIENRAVRAAASAIAAISRAADNGEANFRFAAAARIPPSTPFFPVAYHQGAAAFAIGLESADLVREAFRGHSDSAVAAADLETLLENRLDPIVELASGLAGDSSLRFAGIDLSPAPSLDASIAAPIEDLSGQPFGGPRTLAACAAVTRGLRSTSLPACGYSGLMLPLLEDRILAQRAVEGRLDIQNLLLYSSVCGTGLDLIPVPGESAVGDLAGTVLDMATLADRLEKPLAARLLPMPDKRPGDAVDFANPHLTRSVVLPLA